MNIERLDLGCMIIFLLLLGIFIGQIMEHDFDTKKMYASRQNTWWSHGFDNGYEEACLEFSDNNKLFCENKASEKY